MSITANISEVFVSVQGEGTLIGTRQIFVRFVGCNLNCDYCDTPNAHSFDGELDVDCSVEVFNPVDADTLLAILLELRKKQRVDAVSFTGGEPLLHANFLHEIMPALKREGFSQYLETNGTLANELQSISGFCDFVAADYKPMPLRPNIPEDAPLRFARIIAGAEVDGCIKLVVDSGSTEEILKEAAECACVADMPLVLMPVSLESESKDTAKLNIERLIELQTTALEVHADVRIIARQHTILGLR